MTIDPPLEIKLRIAVFGKQVELTCELHEMHHDRFLYRSPEGQYEIEVPMIPITQE